VPATKSTVWGFRERTALGIAGGLTILLFVAFWLELGTGGLMAGLVLAVVPVPIYVTLALWLDRYDPEPVRLLVKAFGWGAIVAVFFSVVVNEWVAFITGSDVVTSVIAAPFGEEVMKAGALLLLFHYQRHHFDNITDGVVYATMVGLGFATTENIYYYGSAALEGSAETVFLLRGTVSPFAHPLFTAMTGIGIGWARESENELVQAFAPIGGLAMAISLHVVWNAAARADLFFPVYLLTMMPAFIAVLIIVRRSLHREERILREYLRPHVRDGVLAESQLDEICGTWVGLHTIRRRLIPRLGSGPAEEGSLHLVAIELAFHRWRVAREGSAEVPADHEEALVRKLRQLSGS
jgi:RsiW-degrading membrane proteinase PrsW (M82 family)